MVKRMYVHFSGAVMDPCDSRVTDKRYWIGVLSKVIVLDFLYNYVASCYLLSLITSAVIAKNDKKRNVSWEFYFFVYVICAQLIRDKI